jgi:NADH:ubiquinone oxidoreductase subunit 2 (subunit N)
MSAEIVRNTLTSTDYIRILPEIVLSVFGMIVMLADTFLDDNDNRKSLGVISALGILARRSAPRFYMAQFPGRASTAWSASMRSASSSMSSWS